MNLPKSQKYPKRIVRICSGALYLIFCIYPKVSLYQKAYSILSQAYQYAREEYGVPSTWGFDRDAMPSEEEANAQNYKSTSAIAVRDRFIGKIHLVNSINNIFSLKN